MCVCVCVCVCASSRLIYIYIYINREETHERKKNRYNKLLVDCVEKCWICHVIPIEVDCRGFLGHSVISFL